MCPFVGFLVNVWDFNTDDNTEKSCTASTSHCPMQSLGKSPKALHGTMGGTCSARFFRPVMKDL